jgi:hypothetical protein
VTEQALASGARQVIGGQRTDDTGDVTAQAVGLVSEDLVARHRRRLGRLTMAQPADRFPAMGHVGR